MPHLPLLLSFHLHSLLSASLLFLPSFHFSPVLPRVAMHRTFSRLPLFFLRIPSILLSLLLCEQLAAVCCVCFVNQHRPCIPSVFLHSSFLVSSSNPVFFSAFSSHAYSSVLFSLSFALSSQAMSPSLSSCCSWYC